MSRVRKLLEDAFAEQEQEEASPRSSSSTQQEKAQRLGISQSYYSKVIKRESLSAKLAQRFAKSIWVTRQDRQETLRKSLSATDSSSDGPGGTFIRAVEAFFSNLVAEVDTAASETCPFLLVEYRDKPRAGLNSRYPLLSKAAGSAVAKGLCMAQVQPFALAKQAMLPAEISKPESYKCDLASNVRSVGEEIMKSARESAKTAVLGQVVRYELKDTSKLLAPTGISTRMFYADYCVENGGRDFGVWEWVSGVSHDVFLRRDPSSLDAEVFRDQFSPIYEYWQRHRKLATQTNDLDDLCPQAYLNPWEAVEL